MSWLQASFSQKRDEKDVAVGSSLQMHECTNLMPDAPLLLPASKLLASQTEESSQNI